MLVRAPNCAACPLSKNGQMPERAVPGKGPLYDPDLVILGEGPGGDEEREGEPFIGRSGKLLDEALARAGADRSRIRIDNAALCRPPRNSKPEIRQRAAECCWPRLESELTCNSAPIIAYGKVAAQILKGEACDIMKDNGTAFKWRGRHVIMSLHPAYILRQLGKSKHPDGMLWAMSAHIKNALGLIRGEPYLEIDEEKDLAVYLEPDEGAAADLRLLHEEAKKWGFIGCDTEAHPSLPPPYSAKHPMAAAIDMFGFATPERSIAVAYPSPAINETLKEIMADRNLAKVFHNLPYDLASCKRHGLKLRGQLDCTLLQHHAVFPGARHGLQHAGTFHTVVSPWKSEYRNSKKDSPEERGIYCAKDTLTTSRMHYKQQPMIDELGLREMYQNDVFNARLAARMTLVGMPVDRDENARLREVFQKKIDEHREKVLARLDGFGDDLWRFVATEQAMRKRKGEPDDYRERVEIRFQEIKKGLAKGKYEWKVRSAEHLGAYCHMVGQPITVRTEKGYLSTKKEVLQELAAKSPEIASLRILLENLHLKSQFVDNVYDHVAIENGKEVLKRGWAINDRVHPVWSVNKLPGRWGSAMNMVMNIPKDDPRRGRPNLRTQYKSKPGFVQVGFDYSSLHPRIIAALSGDNFLKRLFREKRDIHSEIAAGIWPEFKTLKCPEPCEVCTRALEKGEVNKNCPKKCQPKCGYCSGADEKAKMCARKKRMRDHVKAPEYTWLYRGTVHTAWLQACEETPGLPIANIERMFAGMKRTMPGVWAWQERLLKAASQPPYEVRDAAGWRCLTFHLGQPSPSDVVNFPVLASETYLMHMGLRKITPRLKNYKYAETIHYGSDAVTWEVREDEADRLMEDVGDCFEIEWRGVPFPIDLAKGQSYAET